MTSYLKVISLKKFSFLSCNFIFSFLFIPFSSSCSLCQHVCRCVHVQFVSSICVVSRKKKLQSKDVYDITQLSLCISYYYTNLHAFTDAHKLNIHTYKYTVVISQHDGMNIKVVVIWN